MREDARRNQQRILDAARTAIIESGSAVSMDQIAKTAGVAVGTLYRHYATKTDLVAAVLDEFIASLVQGAVAAGSALTAPGDAVRALRALLEEYLDGAAASQAIKDAATALGAGVSFDVSGELSEVEEQGRAALEVILDRAQADGDVRQDATIDDLFLIMMTAPSSLPKPARTRWIDLMVAGLSARASA